MKIDLRIKTLLIILISYLTSILLIQNVFLANSPEIRPNLGVYLASKVKNTFNRLGGNLASLIKFPKNLSLNSITNRGSSTGSTTSSNNTVVEKLKNQPSNVLTKGVYAKTEGGNTLIEIDTSQIDFVEYTFNVNGKEIKVKMPKDQPTPPAQVLEKLY